MTLADYLCQIKRQKRELQVLKEEQRPAPSPEGLLIYAGQMLRLDAKIEMITDIIRGLGQVKEVQTVTPP